LAFFYEPIPLQAWRGELAKRWFARLAGLIETAFAIWMGWAKGRFRLEYLSVPGRNQPWYESFGHKSVPPSKRILLQR
jgi:hypothetical protein